MRRAAALLVVATGLVVLGLVVFMGDDGKGRSGPLDPLSFDENREDDLARRAAAGLSDPLYEHSPGGVVESARRTARWRPQVDSAASANDVDPGLLEAIVFLESAGRPDIIAGGSDPESAAGLTQILAQTATGLLGMKVDLERSRALTRQIARAEGRGLEARTARLRRARRRVDDRFDPAKALMAAGRYLKTAKDKFGRDDLAVASYHMGMGNLENVIDRFGEGDDVSYTRLYFGSTPLTHVPAYSLLSSFGDDSSTYWWRVLAARDVMSLLRSKPDRLESLEDADILEGPAGRRLPGASDEEPENPAALPRDPAATGLSFRGEPRLRPAAMKALVYIGTKTRALSTQTPPVVASGSGSAFDIARRYRSRRQALAFEFMLDRLQALNLIAWVRGASRIRVTAGPEASKLPSP